MDEIQNISTDWTGATTITTKANVVLTLSPEASAQLASHLISATTVSLTLLPDGRYLTAVTPRQS